MDSARWARIQVLFHDAADLPAAEQRLFLQSACGHDQGLAADVLALLEEDARGSSLLDGDLAHVAQQMLGSAPALPPAFKDFGPYQVKRMLGEGGMGVVYLAERSDLGSLVAIKILRDAWLSPARRERFASEQRMLAQLNHPSIARLYDADTLADGTPCFVMEYVEGFPLTDYCTQRGCSIRERLQLFRSVCEAVQYAHGQAVIHRDLKPSNIMVKPDGTIRLLDFGIARQLEALEAPVDRTATGLRLMTPAYAAPEQIRGERVGIGTDVYSLGVILYELLSGRLPFDLSNRTPGEAERMIVEQDPEKPSVAAGIGASSGAGARVPSPGKAAWADLDVLCLTAMHKDAQRRYRSVEALIRDIDHYLKGEPLEARADTWRYRLGKFVGRNRRIVAASALVFAAVVAMAVIFVVRLTIERNHANRQTAIAAAVNQFLSEDLLGRSNPFQSGKPAETLLSAVEQASPAIDRQFKNEPQIAAQLHQTIARALDNRTDYPAARTEYERAAALFNQIGGPLSQDAVVVQLQRASMEARTYESGSLPLAKKILAEQEALLPKIARPRPELSVWLFGARAMIALIGNDAKSAATNFQTALDRAQGLPSFDNGARLALKQRLAFSYIRLGDGVRAEQFSRELIAEGSRLGDPESPTLLRYRLNLAQAFMVQNKFADAVQEANRDYPDFVRMLGADHELTMQLLSTRAQSEGSLGMWDDTVRDDLTIYELAVKKQGPLSFFAVGTLADASLAQCRAGRFAEGEPNARKAFDSSRKAFGERAGLTGGIAYALAGCLIGRGKLDEASKLLEAIDTKATAQLTGDPGWGANVSLAQAEIALSRGDYPAAGKLVQLATPAFSRADAEPYQKHKLEALTAAIARKSPSN